VITVERIHEGIAKCLKRIDELVAEIAEAGDNAAHAEVAYKTEFAKQRLAYRALHDKSTVGQVDDHATDATSDLHLAHLIAASRLQTTREALRASQSRLDGLRSLLSSIKAAT
jgi:hypothetical protein